MATFAWTYEKIENLYQTPFFELISKAYQVYKENFGADKIQLCTLLSIKTGACPEDCKYCPQSAHYQTHVDKEKLMSKEAVIQQATLAKQQGATRFCMGAAWRNPPAKDFPKVLELIQAVKALGLETCVTLGMLNKEQACQLKESGLDYYNHNLDSSAEFYKKVITTRTYEDRLETLQHVSNAGLNVCCGGILGMGETHEDHVAFLLQLASLPTVPQSIPINKLIPIPGTPLEDEKNFDKFEFIKTIAVARIMFPRTFIRLSGARKEMSEEMQAWCFMAGANSMFYGDSLFTTPNSKTDADLKLLRKLGLTPMAAENPSLLPKSVNPDYAHDTSIF